jgi:hypothetical protein
MNQETLDLPEYAIIPVSKLLAEFGTIATPSIAFDTQADTGLFYSANNNEIGISINAIQSLGIVDDRCKIYSAIELAENAEPPENNPNSGLLYKKVGETGLFWRADGAEEKDITAGGEGGGAGSFRSIEVYDAIDGPTLVEINNDEGEPESEAVLKLTSFTGNITIKKKTDGSVVINNTSNNSITIGTNDTNIITITSTGLNVVGDISATTITPKVQFAYLHYNFYDADNFDVALIFPHTGNAWQQITGLKTGNSNGIFVSNNAFVIPANGMYKFNIQWYEGGGGGTGPLYQWQIATSLPAENTNALSPYGYVWKSVVPDSITLVISATQNENYGLYLRPGSGMATIQFRMLIFMIERLT